MANPSCQVSIRRTSPRRSGMSCSRPASLSAPSPMRPSLSSVLCQPIAPSENRLMSYLHSTSRACAKFTEDEQVFAFVTTALSEELILDCAEQSETPMVSVYYHAYPSEDRVEQMSDFWYAPDNFTAERRERTMVDFLDGLDWFEDNANVAIMIEDKPGIREGVEDGLKPALEDLGIEPALEIVYPDFYESPWPNYILQLQSADVTHVIFSASTQPGYAALSMMKAADAQRYRPQWAGGSDTGFAALPQLGAPVDQMLNYTGMGWEPGYFDTGDFDTRSRRPASCARNSWIQPASW
jgi:ABC-type branched-subunit amino acid transport system substrate-binding protein